MNSHFLSPGAWGRFVTSAPVSTRAAGDRTIDYIFSDESVARDGNTISTAGWRLENFLANPVFLWAHDSSQPPIGKVTQIGAVGDQLRGSVRYAEADEYPFADTIFRLTKGGFMNATSVSWLPIEWRYASDKNRPGGIDFKSQELLEISAVPVPALASALATARGSGIDTQPIFDWASRALDLGGFAVMPRGELETLRKEAKMAASARAKKAADWKVGAARDLPVSGKDGWDGPEAAERMLDAAGFNGDSPDSAKARKGFLLYDAANPDLKGSYKEPFADVVDGKLTATAGGVRAAASRLPDVEGASDEAKAEARKVLDGYEAKLKDEKDNRAAVRPSMRVLAAAYRKRGLYELSMLCDLIGYAEYVYQRVVAEAADENDGSPLPARMAAWLDEGNLIIAAMAAEETQENIKGAQGGDSVEAQVDRAVRRALVGLGIERAGRVLSADNERCLRAAHEHIKQAADMVVSVADQNNDPDDADPEQGDGDEARALRARRANALRLKHNA
jgi:hypothetical protein